MLQMWTIVLESKIEVLGTTMEEGRTALLSFVAYFRPLLLYHTIFCSISSLVQLKQNHFYFWFCEMPRYSYDFARQNIIL